MRNKFILLVGLPLILLATGCMMSHEKIEFSSDVHSMAAAPVATSSVPAPPPKLSKQDLTKVELVIYRHLLQRHFWDDGEYTAVFISGDDDEVAALIKEFPHHTPPIKTADHADLRPNRTPVDRQTGKPAMILSVDALSPEGAQVQAIGKWYAGGAVTGFYTFSLKKTGNEWAIESVK